LAGLQDPTALEYGPAVHDLRSSGAALVAVRAAVKRRYPNAKAYEFVLADRTQRVFTEELAEAPLRGPPVEFYVIAGNRPLLGADYGLAIESWYVRFLLTHAYDQDHFFKTLWRKSKERRARFHPALRLEGTPWTIDTVKKAGATNPQAKKLALIMIRERNRYPLPGTQAMVSNLLAFFGMAGTDGVVDITSALPVRLHGIETRGRDQVPANHFSITEDERAIELALHDLSGGSLRASGK
jgi:hypothetical protein